MLVNGTKKETDCMVICIRSSLVKRHTKVRRKNIENPFVSFRVGNRKVYSCGKV